MNANKRQKLALHEFNVTSYEISDCKVYIEKTRIKNKKLKDCSAEYGEEIEDQRLKCKIDEYSACAEAHTLQ